MSTPSYNSARALPPIRLMDKDQILKLNAQALKLGKQITLINGLVLNKNNTGVISLDLRVYSEYR